MDSTCLLCLKFNSDLLNFVAANSNQWQEYEVTRVLEKHFWTMNIHSDSRICLSCWQVVDVFHKFYLSIQEAHENFAKIQVKEEPCETFKEELTSNADKNIVSEYLASEIHIKDEHPDDSGSSTEEINDHSEDSDHEFIYCETNVENDKVKLEPANSFDNDDSDSESDGGDLDSLENENSKKRPSREENDKFIAEHFKQMFCDLCLVPFENFSSIPKHFLTAHNIKNGYLVCCNRKFYQRNPLVDHLHSHLDPDYLKCKQCGKILSDRKNLNNHMLRAHQPNDIAQKHSCEICGKSFIKVHLLRDHKLKHLSDEEKKFPCKECGKRYATSYLLKVHTELVHLKKHSKICHICGKTLNNSTQYKVHVNKHKGISSIVNCDICGLRLTNKRSLKLHKESQHPIGGKKEHPCPVCNRISPTAEALKKHIIIMHKRGFDYKCTVCEKAFRRAESLKEHMASLHTGATLYKCPWCPRTFNSSSNMHTHRKNVHPKENLELRLQKYSKNIPPEIS